MAFTSLGSWLEVRSGEVVRGFDALTIPSQPSVCSFSA